MNDMAIDSPASAQQTQKLTFEFRGDGLEYFKIWIVNILLSIVTLGIYSAWATVRNNRYFHSNLYLNDNNFRYLAKPLTILKGRLIAIAVFICVGTINALYPPVSIIFVIGLFIAMPYFVNQSLAFNRRMSSYNNIQFRFKASYGQAFMALFVWPFLGMLTMGILYPMAFLKMNEYIVNNSAYGTQKFTFNATYSDYGKIFLVCLAIALVLGIPAGLIMNFAPSLSVISSILIILIYAGVFLYFTMQAANLFYRSLALADHGFEANITMQGLVQVILTNMLLTIVTFGLYLPAAKVRATKYICSCITMNASGSLDTFTAAEKENVSALGEELGQVFDFAV